MDDVANNGASALLVAAQEGHSDIVQLLLNKGADVNVQKAKSGQTALWSAAYNGNMEVGCVYVFICVYTEQLTQVLLHYSQCSIINYVFSKQ